jgi:N-methylhydantoinase A/oxoprolinase/acetone carboxylase beta subunit
LRKESMDLGLGIDTGGTFTDSVIVDLATERVLSKAKAPTTREDLKCGVERSLQGLDAALLPQVRLASLSTTLATNSIVEGKGSRVGILAAVQNPATFSFPARMPADRIAVVAGAHDNRGSCSVDLDVAGATEAVRAMAGEVDAFAVSGYFSIYNAEHEVRLKELIAAETGLPVVCGHELSGAVGLVERAVTAALNARLLPVIRELLDAVREILRQREVDAPLMVVKGDGTLISENTARNRPVETVLSGPAASIAGACRLAGLQEAVVLDMGGTTTDIGVVKNGEIATTDAGAVVGGWQTRVRAVDMWTVGLGGDSKISLSPAGGFVIGPRRAIPLCAAALRDGSLHGTLLCLADGRGGGAERELEFYTLVRRPSFPLSRQEQRLFELLDGKVVHRDLLEAEAPFVPVERFVELGSLAEVTFTPTDLMHLRGDLDLWDRAAAEAGAAILARLAGIPVAVLIETLHREITSSLALQLAAKSLQEDKGIAGSWSAEKADFLGQLLRLTGEDALSFVPRLDKAVIAVGAPVRAYLPTAVASLGGRLLIPEHAEVANAFGAVTGRVVELREVHVRPGKPDGFVVAAAEVQRRFDALEEALAFAEEHARLAAKAGAEARGAVNVIVALEREEESLPLQRGWGDRVLIEIRVKATAVGPPLPASGANSPSPQPSPGGRGSDR